MADKVERQNVLLKNGTTVAAHEYEEDVHGKSVEESDDEYTRRMASRPSGQPAGANYPKTTIGGLQTFDPATDLPSAPVVAHAPSPVAAPALGKPVAIAEPAKDGKDGSKDGKAEPAAAAKK